MLKVLLITIFNLIIQASFAQYSSIQGKITSQGKVIEYANVVLTNTSFGSATDTFGNYSIQNIPVGNYKIRVSCIGYSRMEKAIKLRENEQLVLNFDLSDFQNSLNEIVVTGTRTSRRQLESPIAVDILDSRTFNITQSNTLSDGLCFQPGLRMESDCQTCNYTQLRMNGLGGSYSQILINSRPIFSSLMSLYGLEQIPSNMIERVEVVRGGGSVLYGTSAIAGTVNIITKMPKKSSFTLSNNYSLIDGNTSDNFFNANVNSVNEDQTAGVSFFASNRIRNWYDANGDGFSELPKVSNNSFGFNSFFKVGKRSKLEINGWNINEERQGGDKVDERADKASQAEYRQHNILLGGFNFEHESKDGKSSFSTYASAQNTKRLHYTGIDQADAWGNTKNYSVQGGVQYNYTAFDFLSGKNVFTTGLENQMEYTFDQIPLYNYLINQQVNLLGLFAQSDWEINRKFTMLSGLRINKSNRVAPLIFTPKWSFLYKPNSNIQLRTSYARGFKAPQAFETDMHIAFANGGVSIIQVDKNLKEETSNSFNASFDFNDANEKRIYGFTIQAFYTQLINTFVLSEIGTDSNGNQRLFRYNGGNSTVMGITFEGRWNYNQKLQLESGLTFQKSEYDKALSWSADLEGTKKYLRTPNSYGFYTLTLLPKNKLNVSFSGVYTGKMLVPHFGGAPEIQNDILFTSPSFFENNIKLTYLYKWKSVKQDVQFSCGVQNMFNQYQSDFDTTKNRDSNYIYGPAKPRTFFVGIKLGLL